MEDGVGPGDGRTGDDRLPGASIAIRPLNRDTEGNLFVRVLVDSFSAGRLGESPLNNLIPQTAFQTGTGNLNPKLAIMRWRTLLVDELKTTSEDRGFVDTTETVDAVACWRFIREESELPVPPYSFHLEDHLKKFLEAVNAAAPPLPYLYLAYIGTVNARVGNGTALVRRGLQAAALNGLKRVALWTGSEDVIGFYEKLGFSLWRKVEETGLTGWWIVLLQE